MMGRKQRGWRVLWSIIWERDRWRHVHFKAKRQANKRWRHQLKEELRAESTARGKE